MRLLRSRLRALWNGKRHQGYARGVGVGARRATVPHRKSVALGVPGGLFASSFARAYLFGVTSRDPLTIVAATGVLLGAALMAASAPARAAARLDPMLALRRE